MPKLGIEDRAAVRAIIRDLDWVDARDPCGLGRQMGQLREALRTEKLIAYALKLHGHGLAIDFAHGDGMDLESTVKSLNAVLSRRPDGWFGYDPLRPEANQRNRVFTRRQLGRLIGPEVRPIEQNFPLFGLEGRDQLRVLVCEGASLLAYVAAFQPDPFDVRQHTILSAVAPALRRRLKIERDLAEAKMLRFALPVAMEAIGRPAFLLGTKGALWHANAAGRALYDGDRTVVMGALVDAVLRRPTTIAFDLQPLRDGDAMLGWLAIAREDVMRRSECRTTRAASRWSLTRRQSGVLRLLGRGLTNRTIAAELQIAERTVELHVSAIFDRAGVSSRASLVAALAEY